MLKLTSENFNSEILQAEKAIVVFGQSDSTLTSKTLQFLSTQIVKFGFVDFDVEIDLVHQFNILELPTVFYFKKGLMANKTYLVQDENMLKTLIGSV